MEFRTFYYIFTTNEEIELREDIGLNAIPDMDELKDYWDELRTAFPHPNDSQIMLNKRQVIALARLYYGGRLSGQADMFDKSLDGQLD